MMTIHINIVTVDATSFFFFIVIRGFLLFIRGIVHVDHDSFAGLAGHGMSSLSLAARPLRDEHCVDIATAKAHPEVERFLQADFLSMRNDLFGS
jgi:hypothetical protein